MASGVQPGPPLSKQGTSIRPIRVLQVVPSMKRGGIETLLMHVLRNIDRTRFQIDFLASNRSKSPWEEEILELGGHIYVCMAQSQPLRFAYNLARFLRTHGPYDIVHAHLHHLNGIVSAVAALSGVPVRIVHSHFNIAGANASDRDLSSKYRFAKMLIRVSSTGALAASAAAGRALYGPEWDRHPNNQVFPGGIDITPFYSRVDAPAVRSALDIPADAIVVGHAGRFVTEKNHRLFLDIALQYAKLDSRAHFLLVGDGPLKKEMMDRAAASGLADRVHFTGVRSDVPLLMLGAMDCFLFPSISEAAPVVLVEAQAAGLPCVISDVIPSEVLLYPPLVSKVSLRSPPEEWAAVIQRAMARRTAEHATAARKALEASAFNIRRSVSLLESYYLKLLGLQEDRGRLAEVRDTGC